MDWSWCPCIAIMTSALSSTNILIFLGSTALCRKIQSNIVPGVANKMWSVTFWPGDTEREKYPNIRKKIMWSLFASSICSEILTKGSKLNCSDKNDRSKHDEQVHIKRKCPPKAITESQCGGWVLEHNQELLLLAASFKTETALMVFKSWQASSEPIRLGKEAGLWYW